MNNIKWFIQVFLVNLIFLGSIFVIYFRSPVLKNLEPQNDLRGAPSKRLVLFVMDGLRSESFFKNKCKHIPHIQSIFSKHGLVGLSHTRVPTESRPGHIALASGFYEDPSAVLKGWSDNPIDFDSVFNRSRKTYAWGSYDILSVFSKRHEFGKVEIFSYGEKFDFSGRTETHLLDTWVFEHVEEFLLNFKENLLTQEKVIYFLHLLGTDTAGHIHKPGSSLFLENLRITDAGIQKMYDYFQTVFLDNMTTYLLTSDHGMTDRGSHGAGSDMETETPFFAWGAGIKDVVGNHDKNAKYKQNACMPTFNISQISIAPLISTLLGIAVPVNNYGKLPYELLNVSLEYKAKAYFNNAKQILAQYKKLLLEFEKGIFSCILPTNSKLSRTHFQVLENDIETSLKMRKFNRTIELSEKLLEKALSGVEYFHNYYQKPLLFSTSLSFVGWIIYLTFSMMDLSSTTSVKRNKMLYVGGAMLIAVLTYLQNIPYNIGFYLSLPIFMWAFVVQTYGFTIFSLKIKYATLLKIVVPILGTELLVLTFFNRKLISLAFLGYIFIEYIDSKKNQNLWNSSYIVWIVTSIVLSLFPLLPDANGKQNNIFVFLGGISWLLRIGLSSSCIQTFSIIYYIIGLLNVIVCLYFDGVIFSSYFSIILSWLILCSAFILPIFKPKRNRLEELFVHLLIGYIHLSLNYEILCFVTLGIHLLAWNSLVDNKIKNEILIGGGNYLSEDLWKHLQLSFGAITYVFLSFFGTGNIASISSFDPLTARCFVIHFSPFIISGLVILKLVIPLIFIFATLWNVLQKFKRDEKKMFTYFLILCQLMSLNFLFLVTNQGSWLDIGTSISHFVIMEFTVLVLVLVNSVSKLLMTSFILNYFAKFSKNI